MQTYRTFSPVLASSDTPVGSYDREPTFSSMIKEKDVAVPMRDGVQLSVDVYRPEQAEKFPALLAFASITRIFRVRTMQRLSHRSLPGHPYGPDSWKPATPTFSYRVVTFTSLARRAASASHNPADQENGIATISLSGLQPRNDATET
jgi:hypothetical protein